MTDQSMLLTGLKRRGRTRCEIQFDGGRAVVLDAETVRRAGLRVGDRLDVGRWDAILEEDRALRAREKALRLLAVRARSVVELRRRLVRDGFEAPLVGTLLDSLIQAGLIDDAAFAAAFVRDRLRGRPRAASRLVNELRQRGVSAEIAQAAVRREFDDFDTSDEALALRVAERWARRAPPRRARDAVRDRTRLIAHLARRGFGGAVAARAAAAALGGTPDPGATGTPLP
jgi:regulatory protein